MLAINITCVMRRASRIRAVLTNHAALMPLSAILLAPYVSPSISTIRHFSVFYILFLAVWLGKVKVSEKRFLFAFASIASLSVLISSTGDAFPYNLKYFSLLLSPLVAVLIFHGSVPRLIPRLIKQLFILSCVVQMWVILQSKVGLFSMGLFQSIAFGDERSVLLSASSEIESGFCFIFAYFSIYYFQRRRYWLLVIAIFLMLLNFKRIVFLGFCGGIAFELLINRLHYVSKTLGRLIWLIPFVSLLMLLGVSTGNWNGLIKSTTGASVNQLTTGRYKVYHELYQNLFSIPEIIIGHGLGTTNTTVTNYEYTNLVLAHSDYLLLFYDFGIIGFVAFFYLLKSRLIRTPTQFPLTIFFFIVLSMDNTIIYFDVMFVFYLLSLHIKRHSGTLHVDPIISTKP